MASGEAMRNLICQGRNSLNLFFVLVYISVVATIALIGCSKAPAYVPGPASPSSPTPTLTPRPALTVKIDYFGIKSAHRDLEPVSPKIQLHVVVDDGKTKQVASFPPNNEGMIMEDFYLEDLMGQGNVFHTPSVGDYLRVSVLAYWSEDKEAKLAMWRAMEALEPGVSTLRELYEKLPQKKVLIGYYENIWYPTQNWGIGPGKYEAVGSDDLRLWFRIWSTSEPEVIPKPQFGPEVRILAVSLPSSVKKRSASEVVFVNTYPTTITLQNNEGIDIPVDVTIEGQGQCLDLISFTGGKVTVPKYGHKEITAKYYYETAGARVITYTIYYRGMKIDSWSGTLNVLP